jgi:hypothetical protein
VRLKPNESIEGMVQRDSRLVEPDAAPDSVARLGPQPA